MYAIPSGIKLDVSIATQVQYLNSIQFL